MKYHVLQNAFNSGELSPYMLGRSDLAYYKSGMKTLENWLIRPQGGIIRRSGTRFVREVQDSSIKCRLVPFVFSSTQAYILEFSENLIRFCMDEGSVLEAAQAFNDLTIGATTIVTINGHPFNTGEMVFITGIVGTTELNNRHFTITKTGANTFTLDGEDSSGYTAYVSGGTAARVYQVVTTYTEAELPDLRFAQSADELYIVHEAHPPAVLTRTAHTSWTLTDFDFIDGPYLELRVQEPGDEMDLDTLTVDPNSDSGNVVFTSFANLFDDPRDVGRMMRYDGDASGGTNGWAGCLITAVTDATHCNATIVSGKDPAEKPPYAAGQAVSGYWYLGAYYPDNYPRTVAFFEGRLAFAGTPLEPERIDASVTGGWNDFRPTDREDNTVRDDSGFSYQLGGANDVQVIRWLATVRNLVIGTTGGIWPVQASSSNEAVTPTNINLPRSSAYGCAAVQPVTAYDTVVYVSRSGKKILAAGYSYDPDAYQTQDLTIMAEHISGAGIDAMEFQQEPHSIVWCVRNDGQLAGMTYERGQKVYGWHRQIIGGAFSTGNAVVESVAVIPAPNEDHDQLWMIVKRTVNGSTVRYIEFLEDDFSDTDAQEDAYFVDCGLTYDGTAVSSLTGLNHLEGETVAVLADGAVHPSRTVTNGAIALNGNYSVVHVGYGYNSDAETLPLEFSDRIGSTADRVLRPTHATIRLHRTLGLQFGADADSLEVIPFRSTSDPMDSSPPIFTGLKTCPLSHAHGKEAILYLRQSDPLPATILYIAGTVGVSDR